MRKAYYNNKIYIAVNELPFSEIDLYKIAIETEKSYEVFKSFKVQAALRIYSQIKTVVSKKLNSFIEKLNKNFQNYKYKLILIVVVHVIKV